MDIPPSVHLLGRGDHNTHVAQPNSELPAVVAVDLSLPWKLAGRVFSVSSSKLSLTWKLKKHGWCFTENDKNTVQGQLTWKLKKHGLAVSKAN